MIKGIGCVYKYRQCRWKYPSPNTIFTVQQCLVYKISHVNTGGNSASTNYIIRTKPLSSQNTTNIGDMNVTVYNKPQYFTTPIKTITVPLHLVLTTMVLTMLSWNLIHCSFKKIPQLIWHIRNYLHMERGIFVFKLIRELPWTQSFSNQVPY